MSCQVSGGDRSFPLAERRDDIQPGMDLVLMSTWGRIPGGLMCLNEHKRHHLYFAIYA